MQLLFTLSGLNGLGGKDARAALFASFVVAARNSPSSPSSPSASPLSSPVAAARLIVWDNLRGNIAELPLPLLQPAAEQSEETRTDHADEDTDDADNLNPVAVPSLPGGGETASIAVLGASDDGAAPESEVCT
ncbi:hypothetical protein DFJ73DRAFT_781799 [Zopfochytrium polystomum]|nr:hypothetical protein DFJ73DRAFT_781799 [Zopfochytrium polystomum]